MRVHTSSTGLDAAALVPGEDIVLTLDEAHGLDLPHGALAHDHLDMELRAEVDAATLEAASAWSREREEAFTVDGIRLPWIWQEVAFTRFVTPAIRDTVGIVRAVREHGVRRLELADADAQTQLIARAAADAAGIEVAPKPVRSRDAAPLIDEAPPASALTRARRAAIHSVTQFGFPTVLRSGSVLFLSYWPTVPLFDRLLSEPGGRPAVSLQNRPPSPARSLRAALRGGWVGMPGPRDRAAGRRGAERILGAAGNAPRVEAMGVDVGPVIHAGMVELALSRAADDLANAAFFRRVFRRGRVRQLVVAYDVEPHSRLVVSLAREAGIPSLLVEHGAYVLPRTVTDMEVSDELAIWSEHVAPSFHRNGRPVHEVGFPLSCDPPRWGPLPAGRQDPRVVVVGQSWDPYTMRIDRRNRMRHDYVALEQLRERLPRARVVLRPHPLDPLRASEDLQRRFAEMAVEIDAASDIHDLLRGCDLCIGSASTATFQAALEGVPVIALNVTGFEWAWPLGGETTVPVAHSGEELGRLLERFAAGELLPGQDDLVRAVGADRRDTTERLLERIATGATA